VSVIPDVKAERGGSVVVARDADEAVFVDVVTAFADIAALDDNCAEAEDAAATETALSQGMTTACCSWKRAPLSLQQLCGSGRGLWETWQQ
jgi:hypothetical protein